LSIRGLSDSAYTDIRAPRIRERSRSG